jgi:methylated-DNA-[protein]-cysteine S-methyltransferase
MRLVESHVETPLGRLRLLATDQTLAGIYFPEHAGAPAAAPSAPPGHEVLEAASAQLRQYFAGERTSFELPLAPEGTEFQRQVWAALGAIPYGETRSYGDLAGQLQRRKAVRAVGAANGRNPLSIVVPCHRVVGADGSLTGYAGGAAAKAWLLAHEQRTAATSRR